MTTSVTIKNNGPHRVNVNEVETAHPLEEGKTQQAHTLDVGGEVTVNIWGWRRYIQILETDE